MLIVTVNGMVQVTAPLGEELTTGLGSTLTTESTMGVTGGGTRGFGGVAGLSISGGTDSRDGLTAASRSWPCAADSPGAVVR
jgi:hypothetical protein